MCAAGKHVDIWGFDEEDACVSAAEVNHILSPIVTAMTVKLRSS